MLKPVAAILVNWNTPKYTIDCINSLLTYCDVSLFDIIVADNGSTDGSLSIIKAEFPDLIYIDNKENLGFAEGHNRPLAYSIEKGYTYSIILNTDTLVDEDIITKLSTHLNNFPKAAAVQPAIYWMHNRSEIWNGRGCYNSILGKTYNDNTIPITGNDSFENASWVTGCCILFRNAALKGSGLFCKRFFIYYEDVDLSFRLRSLGHEVHYLPSCKMYHEAGVTGKKAKSKEGIIAPILHLWVSRNHIWFLRKHANPIFYPTILIYNGFYYAALLTYFIIRGRNKKAGCLIKGIKEGLFTPKSLIWPEEAKQA
jgi:GT2 family glycosyltransferase